MNEGKEGKERERGEGRREEKNRKEKNFYWDNEVLQEDRNWEPTVFSSFLSPPFNPLNIKGDLQMVIAESNELTKCLRTTDSNESPGVQFGSSLSLRNPFCLVIALKPLPD